MYVDILISNAFNLNKHFFFLFSFYLYQCKDPNPAKGKEGRER